MLDIDVTVILPIYNTEDFLDAALRSARANDRCALEILCLNDGSTDGSLDIMRAHAAQDGRVRVIDKENQGYGATMNRGIAEARGRYVAILEPDDYVLPHMYDELYAYALRFGLPDIAKSSYWRVVDAGTDHEHRLRCLYYGRVRPPHQPFQIADAPRLVTHHPSIWSALYRRGFLEDKGIAFKEVPGAGWVDNPFWYETMCQAKSIVYTDEAWYCYREDLASSSSSQRSIEMTFDRWEDMADVVERLGVTDVGVRRALAGIALRYIGEAIAHDGLSNDVLRERMGRMLARIDDETLASVDSFSPEFRALAFELSGREAPEMSAWPHRRFLAEEFGYYLRSNGASFALSRIGLYLQRLGEGRDKDTPTSHGSVRI